MHGLAMTQVPNVAATLKHLGPATRFATRYAWTVAGRWPPWAEASTPGRSAGRAKQGMPTEPSALLGMECGN